MSKKRKITINKNNKSIEFINNNIAFSQFGIANEILDLIIDIQLENEKYKKILDKIKEIMNTTPDTNYSYDYVILKNEIYKSLEKVDE